jgi:putative endonuclease
VCSANLEFGKAAESAAAKFLKAKGYKILERNYRNRFGEIDIIAQQAGVICFLEVKARHSLAQGLPCEAVDARKRRQISRVALAYLKQQHFLDRAARFDVLGLLWTKNTPEITLITNAFELSSEFTI